MRLPLDFFPPHVDKFNAYAIRGTGEARKYLSLFPGTGTQPDFHRLEDFGDLPKNHENLYETLKNHAELSATWRAALKHPQC